MNEGFSNEMDNAVKGAILEAIKSDPKFKEEFKQLINKIDDPDEIHILIRPNSREDRIGNYTITTVKRRNEFSSIPIGELPLNEKLLKDLYEQLKEFYKDES